MSTQEVLSAVTGDDPSLEQAESILAGLAAGSMLAGYRVESRIGAGGMAVVFRAREEALRRTVALKVLVPTLAGDSEFRARFIRESRSATAVDHPHIIPIYAAGEAGGVLYIAMRYVSGGDLRALISREGPLPAERAANLLSPLASALDAGHAIGLVHRDVKPANVLIDTRSGLDHPYLSDYGLAKGIAFTDLTATGQFVGTLEYCAPEQIAGKVVGPATDQYALGCVAYTMLTGAVPFPREEASAVMWAHMSEPPPSVTALRPDLPRATDQILARAMAKAPEDRYPTCELFIDAFSAALGVGGSGILDRISPGSKHVSVLETPASPPPTQPDPPPPVPLSPTSAPQARSTAQSVAAAALPFAKHQVFRSHPPSPLLPHPLPRHKRLTDSHSAAVQMVVPPADDPAVAVRPPGGQRIKEIPKPRRRRAVLAVSAAIVVALGGTGAATWLLRSHEYPLKLAAILPEPDGTAPVAVAFTPNGGLVTVDLKGRANLWNLRTRRAVPAVTVPSGFASVALSADGFNLVAIVNTNSAITRPSAFSKPEFITSSISSRSWTDTTGPLASDPFTSGALSSTGGVLATVGSGTPNSSTEIWDISDGFPLASLNSPDGQAVVSVAVSPDGSTVASSDGAGMTYLWNGTAVSSDGSAVTYQWANSTPAALRSPGGAPVSSSAFSANGQTLITGDVDGKGRIWDVATGRLVTTLSDPTGDAVTVVALNPNGTLAATADSGDNEVSIWDIASGALIGTVTDPHSRTVTALSFSKNGTELAVADANGSTYVWRISGT